MKKKLLVLFMLLVTAFFFIALPNNNSNDLFDIKEAEAASADHSVLYLNTGGSSLWDQGGAWFAAYFYGNGNTWRTMSCVGQNLYAVETPTDKSYPNVIFVRMKNTDTSTLDFGNSWNQTPDLTISSSKNLYTITKWSEGNWGTSSVVNPTNEKLYLKPNSTWYSDNARFAAYFTDGTYYWWSNMTVSNIDTTEKIYEVSKPSKNFTKVIYVRMDGSKADNNWANKWNQTVDINLPSNGDNMYKLNVSSINSGNDNGKYDGGWSEITLSTVSFNFATDQALTGLPKANACISFDGENGNNIWTKVQMTKDSSQTYREKTVYTVTIPVLYGCVDILQFLNSSDGLIKDAIGTSSSKEDGYNIEYFSEDKLYYYGTSTEKVNDEKEVDFTGWKGKMDINFHANDGKGTIVSINVYVGNKFNQPTGITHIDSSHSFTGWYDNKELSGVSMHKFTASLDVTDYYGAWGIAFAPGTTLYLIPYAEWIDSGTVAVNLYGGGANLFYNMNLIVNSDGSKIYSFTIPNDTSYTCAIFVWVKEEVKNDGSDWGRVNGQTNDLTQSEDGCYGYDVTGYVATPKPRYTGSWVPMSSFTANNHNATEVYKVTHKVGYDLDDFTISAPNNKTFIGMTDELGNQLTSFDFEIQSNPKTYTETWANANHVDVNLHVYYKETSTKYNSYGIQPFIAGMKFTLDESITHSGSGNYEYVLSVKTKNGVQVESFTYNTYAELYADLRNIFFEIECLDSNGNIDYDKLAIEYSVVLEVKDKNNNNIYLNSLFDTVHVVENEHLSIATLVDQYIIDQRENHTFDLKNDMEDIAVYQLHEHSYLDATTANEKYICDAYYLYQYCNVCTHKERLDDITVNRTENKSGSTVVSYTYSVTIPESIDPKLASNGRNFSHTSSSMLTYIYENKEDNYTADTREISYAALTNQGVLINRFKSLYDAIEACFNYDERNRSNSSYDAQNNGSYVVKYFENTDTYDDVILFRNRTSYIVDNLDNKDMFWYYQDGASIRKYGHYDNNYWTSLLKNSKYITILRQADLNSTPNDYEGEVKVFASSYKVINNNTTYDVPATNSSPAIVTANADAYDYCYDLDSAMSIFYAKTPNGGLTYDQKFSNIRNWIQLKSAEIYPSYNESDKAYAYIGYTSAAEDFILHQGIRCDSSTGNWYYYSGIVTNTTNGITMKEVMFENVSDICYLTSTWDPVEKCYRPDQNINIAITYKNLGLENGKNKLKFTLQLVFDDERIIDIDEYVYSVNDAASFRFTAGLDVDTESDLADYMCGAEFKNLIITYSRGWISGPSETIHNLQNIYIIDSAADKSIFQPNKGNYNTTLYNSIVSSIKTGWNGKPVTNVYGSGKSPSSSDTKACLQPTFYSTNEDTTRYFVPVYNFSYRSIDPTLDSLAPVLREVKDRFDYLDNIEEIVSNDLLDIDDEEVSFGEFELYVDDTETKYNGLSDIEKTVFQISYPDSYEGNESNKLYTAMMGYKQDILNVDRLTYTSKANRYTHTNDGFLIDGITHIEPGKTYNQGTGNLPNTTTEPGLMYYNIKTGTYKIHISLPLYGNVSFKYDEKDLTSAITAKDGQTSVTVTGLYSPNGADWTTRLYTDADAHVFLTPNAVGGSYTITYNPSNQVLNFARSENQSNNFIGPYRYVKNSNGEIVRKYNRLEFTREVDGKIVDTVYYATYDYQNNVYTFDVELGQWDGVAIYYDGLLLTPDNTETIGLYTSGKNRAEDLYWAVDKSGTLQRFMKADPVEGYIYKVVYDPMNSRLYFADGNVLSTISTTTFEKYLNAGGGDITYWAPGTKLHTLDGYWKGIYNSSGEYITNNVNGWRLYVIVDATGKIRYLVNNPVDGYGGYQTKSYYTHPSYDNYLENNDVIVLGSGDKWDLVVPEGGFGITSYETGTDRLLSFLTQGAITERTNSVNTRYAFNQYLRLYASQSTVDGTTTYTITAKYGYN